MVVDTSALCAVLFNEPTRAELIGTLASAPRRVISSGTMVEVAIVVEARLGEAGGRELDLLLHRAGVDVVAVDADQVEMARVGWRRFGKGRHPAGLNFGDLFAYALARTRGEPLLFVGDDFTRTDVDRA